VRRSEVVKAYVRGAIIVAGLLGAFWFVRSIDLFEPVVDPSRYAQLVSDRAYHSIQYRFLPKTIPQDAIRVGFFHESGFGPAIDVIALRLLFSQAKTEEILSELESSGREEIDSLESLGFSTANVYPRYDMASVPTEEIRENVSELPKDFRIFLYKCSSSKLKNQPIDCIFSFTAVSITRNEIVYFVKQ